MSWDTYVHQIQNKFDPATNAWAVTNVSSFAAVYGHDGAAWATSEGFQLASYQFDMPQEDGSTTPVPCHEHAALMKACDGDRKGGQACGIRICNQKYMMMRNSDAHDGKIKFATLSGPGGGACVAKTAQALLVGVWKKESPMSNGKQQNTGDCEGCVINVAKSLVDAGM
jgi:hypothetical protein